MNENGALALTGHHCHNPSSEEECRHDRPLAELSALWHSRHLSKGTREWCSVSTPISQMDVMKRKVEELP